MSNNTNNMKANLFRRIGASRLIRSKKAADFFMIGLVVTVIVVLLTMGIQIVMTQQKFRDIGVVQAELMRAFNEGEKLLTYIDASSKLGVQQAIQNLLNQGGYYHTPDVGEANPLDDSCGKYKGYSLWFNKKECIPDKTAVDASLTNYVTDEVATDLEPYPNVDLLSIDYNYNFIYYPEAIVVIANPISKIGIPLFKELTPISYSSTLPNFETTPNYRRGRSGAIDTIVIHYTAGGSAQNAIDWWRLRSTQASAHYIVDRDGTQIQVVREEDTAWHAGCSLSCANPCDGKCSPCKNPKYIGINDHSIGIELSNWACIYKEGSSKPENFVCSADSTCKTTPGCGCNAEGKTCWEKFSDAQMNSLVELVATIAKRRNIPIDREHIIGHSEVTTCKSDPGPAFDWNKFLNEIRSKAG